jgi:hypothetical protein
MEKAVLVSRPGSSSGTMLVGSMPFVPTDKAESSGVATFVLGRIQPVLSESQGSDLHGYRSTGALAGTSSIVTLIAQDLIGTSGEQLGLLDGSRGLQRDAHLDIVLQSLDERVQLFLQGHLRYLYHEVVVGLEILIDSTS